MSVYYNENDPFAAQLLRELIKDGHIAPGYVDERSIVDVVPKELEAYTQHHFFAGGGVWSYALRQAGWPDDRPIWTGSCPCQPFSPAGREKGFDDERHLWPAWHWLIEKHKPTVIIGEQVAGKAAEPWVDLVQADLEAMDYAFGCVAFPTASVEVEHKASTVRRLLERAIRHCRNPVHGRMLRDYSDQLSDGLGEGLFHIRDRAYWLAYSEDHRLERPRELEEQAGGHGATYSSTVEQLADPSVEGSQGGLRGRQDSQWEMEHGHAGRSSSTERLGDTDSKSARRDSRATHATEVEYGQEDRDGNRLEDAGSALPIGLADTASDRWLGQGASAETEGGREPRPEPRGQLPSRSEGRAVSGELEAPLSRIAHTEPASPTDSFWGATDWLLCRDGNWRPVESGSFPLANDTTSRVGRLRMSGNAISAEAAKAFIEVAIEIIYP